MVQALKVAQHLGKTTTRDFRNHNGICRQPRTACHSLHVNRTLHFHPKIPKEEHRGLTPMRIVPQKMSKCGRTGDRSSIAHGLGGLFDFVTGSSAKVRVLLDEPANGLDTPTCSSPFNVMVIAEAKSEIKYNKVYLKVNCSEELDQYYVSEGDFSGYLNESTSTVKFEIDVAGPGTLLPGEQVQWEVQVDLPLGSLPTFQGRYIQNVWKVEAGIGTGLAGGTNPSSGWLPFVVRA
mmetsp:Transcript_36862/g.80302  ORF Transcript_36862/g.80302 Transcript_36862/m.80302 type:complete len:235 (-) Transcript_36862:155-859(-)|eukprot:CAMPEP_0118935470 /NCGR_PEP_ID=MMETSP1169-20130426/15660_1 /TAXON_ID=36882 /ORGANISM="Pyramimonas obovata, Strain CCMP722" /LENGTH=234 /DNA_ID=CAMNT_0006878513 /DNA_START=29 /DNA_END=733 /DNA_ORIENTATION=+